MSKTNTEPILQEDENRYVLFPIQHDDIYKMYKKQVDCFWRAEEIDLSKDMELEKMTTTDERYFIKWY